MNTVLQYVKPYTKRIALGLSIKTIGTLMDLFIPWILSHIIDNVIPTGNIPMVIIWGGGMIICSILAIVGNISANRMAASVARDTTKRLRHDLFVKISFLSNTEVDKFTIPTLISRMTTDSYAIHHLVGMLQRIGVRAPILLLGGIGITLFLDATLTLAMIAILPLAALLIILISRIGVKLYRKIQIAVDDMVRVVRENATGIRVIKALSKSEHERGRFQSVNEDLTKKEKNAALIMSTINPAMSFLMNAGFVVVIVLGAYRVNEGTSEIGKIIAFMTYFTIILNALMSITRIFTMTSKATASADRIKEVLDAQNERDITVAEEDASNIEEDTSMNIPHIEFRNVSFRYDNSKFLINNVSFSLPHKATLGIIGATGSGKTTLAQLLMRFYDIKSGEILINGKDIRYMTLYDLRSKFGVVFQNDTLFKSTVEENLSLGRDIDLIQIKEAAQHAQAAGFIEEAGGFDAEVAIKGMNFSGGQKQRMLLSRALAGKPEIIILDDASSALDYKTDAKLRAALNTNYKDSTKMIITQRISSVMHADQIMVIDEGKIIGLGKHEDLIKDCQLYQEISASQLGGGEDASS
ncbi:MAG: ABC transporter ATP-binding protein [Clostridia bacterium]|jgi:ATP-binding cassette subfamily B protein|nr:ABC transporter ATP-binding protein [Clostridia bacterium]NLV33610.1 ABC transporter ATP-binding protein [Clostridiaceae bacterium]HPB16414.1 ABC transporter ATP-binding protein [Clostridia bacterium]HQM95610.1 ABC transporter ATP-binding protein [Clostridia bacterium]HQO69173.1 ABC transporter ATP-binding protein [Clostridia bacterium]